MHVQTHTHTGHKGIFISIIIKIKTGVQSEHKLRQKTLMEAFLSRSEEEV
jgi:hypothetical protein